MISKLVTLYLEKNDYHAVEAHNGKIAKDVFLEYHPCLIILDLMLPYVSGEDFCHWVREEVGNKDVPIIMLSAKAQTEDKIKGLRMGADSYVTKPFNPDELMAH